ncbi:hypothetical protein HanIR_Chr17g0888871 [Helianthus annuus]|nr:hypothetical protein HanIR_Chr17g0888871 [Helianthus annuus]
MLSDRIASAFFQEHSSHGCFVYFIFRNQPKPPKKLASSFVISIIFYKFPFLVLNIFT